VAAPDRALCVSGLVQGIYTLFIDGKPVTSAPASKWAHGVVLDRGPEFEQVQSLRRAIIAKNELYFNRWRPQNDTYLYGFRRHEQGRNAAEVLQFDSLIARQEAKIARLRAPVRHTYELRGPSR
jgi:hypothetical protein